jgi:hypothetical protein
LENTAIFISLPQNTAQSLVFGEMKLKIKKTNKKNNNLFIFFGETFNIFCFTSLRRWFCEKIGTIFKSVFSAADRTF